ncbi:MAG: response regulator [Gammaproteobacteria bacterium]
MSARILVVDDEAQIRKFLRISLEAAGYAIDEARTGTEALESCNAAPPDLVVLDLGLPDLDGVEVIARLREWSRVPILVLSVRSLEAQKVTALDVGANDYLTKPFGISELMARCRVLLRDQPAGEDEPVIRSGALTIDRRSRRVSLGNEVVHLSPKEYALLNLLAEHRGRIVTHQQLLRAIWGERHVDDTHYLRVLVGHLRQKLDDDPAHPRYVVTEQGVGYRFGEDGG